MQKLVAKYGAAAHLAILAVAPLFLFAFWGDATQATVLLWLSALAFVWVVLEPSVRNRESLHDARRRVVSEISHDSLFWVSLLLVIFTGVRALNGGIGLAYDAEIAKWYVAEARLPFFPGSVGSSGYLPFSTAVAVLVLLQGCRHALGRSARMSFLLVSSSLAGLASVVAITLLPFGNVRVAEAASGFTKAYSYVGVTFGLHLLSATVATFAVFERKWNSLVVLSFVAVGGTAAGAFVFSPTLFGSAFGIALVLVFIYSFAYACRALEGSGNFKFLVVFGMALTMGGLYVTALIPQQMMQERLTPYLAQSLFGDKFFDIRNVLSAAAFKAWIQHLWIGTGIASYHLDFKFFAQPSDWALVKHGVIAVSNGWWMVLAERGIVGLVALLVPCGFLLFTYVRRAILGIRAYELPHPACLLGPLPLVLLAASGSVDCSFLRTDVLMMAGALMAVAAKGFRKERRA